MNSSFEISTDPLERARLLQQVHAAVLAGDPAPYEPRPVVFESWRRSLEAQIAPERESPPQLLDYSRLIDIREEHPLARWMPMLRETVLNESDSTSRIMIITDADGNILWRDGHTHVCQDADRVGLTEGTRWAEDAIGTNAMGTTLATGTPVQIHSAEHLVRTYHSWTCAACPIRDPENGALLGAVDLSGPLHTMHPALLALVAAAGRMVENELRWRLAASDDLFRQRHEHHIAAPGPGMALLSRSGRVIASAPSMHLVPGQRLTFDDSGSAPENTGGIDNDTHVKLEPVEGGYLLRRSQRRSSHPAELSLKLLGNGVPVATVNGVRHELSLRHAEILALLAIHPEGLTAERLALLLHGEQGNPATVRVEMHRIRNELGRYVITPKPYRITAELHSDLITLREALSQGNVEAAVDHAGLLLPHSESAAICAERDELRASLRGWILASEDHTLLWRLAHTDVGHDDLEILEKTRDLMGPDSPHHTILETKIRLLEQDY